MRRDEFIETMTGLVREWNADPVEVPLRLGEIFDEVRNSTAYELAEAVRQREEALRKYHRELTRPKR